MPDRIKSFLRPLRSLLRRQSYRKTDSPEERERAAQIRRDMPSRPGPLPPPPALTVPVHLEKLLTVAPTPETEKAMVERFFAQITPLLDVMQRSCRKDEVEQWKHVARSAHEAAATLGMPVLENLCYKAEHEPPASYSARLRMFHLIKAETKRIAQFLESRELI